MTIPLLQDGIINLSKAFPVSGFISENIRVENPHLTIDYFNDIDRDTLENYNKVKNYKSLNRMALSHIYVTKSYITNEIIIALSV
jgi:2'-5' RNA ligase